MALACGFGEIEGQEHHRREPGLDRQVKFLHHVTATTTTRSAGRRCSISECSALSWAHSRACEQRIAAHAAQGNPDCSASGQFQS